MSVSGTLDRDVFPFDGSSSTVGTVTFGGSGNDEIRNLLVGGPFRDTLNGGLGNDTANGRGERDTCSAETVISCEEVT